MTKDKTEITSSAQSGGTSSPDNKKTKSLIFQLAARQGLLVVAIFVIMAVLSVTVVAKGTKNDYRDTMESMMPIFAGSVNLWTDQFVHEIHMYTEADIVKTGSTDEIVSWLQSAADRRSEQFSSVFYCTPDGIAHSGFGSNVDISDRDYFKAVMNGSSDIVISNQSVSRLLNANVFEVCVAAYNKDHQKIGFFAGVVKTDLLEQFVIKTKIGKAGSLFIIDGTGTVMAHPDTSMILSDLTKSSDEGVASLADAMLHGKNGRITTKIGGKEYATVFYSPVQGSSWAVGAIIPEHQLNATADHFGSMIIIGCIIFGVLFFAVSATLIRDRIKPLKDVNRAVKKISSGNADLSQRIEESSNNEIGAVVRGFNRFLEKLQSIIGGVQHSKTVLAGAGNELQAGVEDTSAAITQVLGDITSVNGEIINQSASVEETAGAITQISQNIVSLEKMIENQAAGINEASAAVEQMIGNIGTVNGSVGKMADSFSGLQSSAITGISRQEHVSEQIQHISQQSQMLQDANEAIAGIAEQTNLLAMNAAIEAAHAGEAGKGFSVVADEIRKLSETSSEQSKTIGEQLEKIKDSISSVVNASDESGAAFTSVEEKIKQTDLLVKNIRNAMAEQLEGSKQISESLKMMNDSTMEVKTASSEMSAGQQAILEEVKHLQNATAQMKDKMAEMEKGAQRIESTGEKIQAASRNVKNAIDTIGTQIDQFKV
jgi:methyl-accepting chemotaxis protein